MLLAVLERRADVGLSRHDVFVNAAGGLRVDDPSADFAIALAVAGSLRNRSLARGCVVFGEVGLGGEIRRVTRLEARLQEAAALGFEVAAVPAGQACVTPPGLACRPVATLRDALHLLT